MSLFHYTDVAAVMSILEKQEIWLTDVRFLNDSQEFYDGVDFVQSAIGNIAGVKATDGFMGVACNYISTITSSSFKHELEISQKFVCSFSQRGDLLSQWRSYGSYAIEFDKEKFSDSLSLVDCVYCEEQKKQKSLSKLGDSLLYLAGAFRKDGGLGGPEVSEVQMDLVSLCLSFKNKHFSEEAEVRSVVSDDVSSQDIKYRARGGLLVPYVAYDFPIESVKAIHIGPMENQSLAKKSICMLVEQLGVKFLLEGKDKPEINVVCSEIPYRTL
jgi:hypothetical protein